MEHAGLCIGWIRPKAVIVIVYIVMYRLRSFKAAESVSSTSSKDRYCAARARSSAYIKRCVPGGLGWSLVYIKKGVGAGTLPCGSPFLWSRQRFFEYGDGLGIVDCVVAR